MSSAIDASKPADGVPAVKADLRDNLQTAKTELNHGGFAAQLVPANYTPAPNDLKVSSHLAGVDVALGAKPEAFLELADTPASYTGQSSKFVKVKSSEDGVEFVTSAGATSADAVDYAPPLAGIITRTVESRLGDPLLSVKNFGATGDGTTDDTAAIQAALNAARPQGEIVFFPPGQYRVTSTLRIPKLNANGSTGSGHTITLKPLHLLGVGCGGSNGNPPDHGGVSVLLIDHAGVGLDLSRASDDTSLAGFTGRIEGLGFHDEDGSADIAIKAYAVMHARFRDLHIMGFNIGIKVGDETVSNSANGGGWYSDWQKVQIRNCSQYGAHFAAMMHGAQFHACQWSHSGVGVRFGHGSPFHRAGKPIVLTHCFFEGNTGYSIELYQGEHLLLEGGYAEFNDNDVIYVKSGSQAQASVTINGSYFFLDAGTNIMEAVAGDADATIAISMTGVLVNAIGTGSVAVEIPANASRVSISDRGSGNAKVLAGGNALNLTNVSLGTLRAYDASCSQFHANQAGGALNGRS